MNRAILPVLWRDPVPVHTAPTGRIGRRVADLALCRERFPVVFDADRPLPLAIGIDLALAAIIGAKRARFLLAWWCVTPTFIAAVARGGPRYTLNGIEDGHVSEQHRALASLDRAARVARKVGGGVRVIAANASAMASARDDARVLSRGNGPEFFPYVEGAKCVFR